ncbi:MAG: hypothetical protein GY788_22155 [bacterium]|nr:hypothetical protein [bacterium]
MSDQDQTDRSDPRVRELTYRLMAMAPDAPPFPEEATMKVPETKQRQPIFVWAAAVTAVVLLVGLPLFLFRGGDGTTDPATTIVAGLATTTVAEPTTTVPGTTTVPSEGDFVFFHNVYLFSETQTASGGDPAFIPVRRSWDLAANDPDPEEVVAGASSSTALSVAAAIQDLIGLSGSGLAGYSTSIPGDVNLLDVAVDNSVATISLSSEFESGGGTMAMTTRLAQVVFTATQFPEVDSVLFLIDDEVVDVFSGEGLVLDGEPQTREGYVDILPFIFMDEPAIGSIAPSPIVLTGIANVFEATVMYEVVDAGGTVLNAGFTTATCGTGCWGVFNVEVPYSVEAETQGEVVVYEESARDGSRVNEIRYGVTLVPGGDTPVPTTTVPPTSTTLPGEAFDIGPQAGDVVAVIGVAHDDVLNVREIPGANTTIVTTLDPLADDVVATGRHRLLTSSIWNEVEANGVTGWVNSRYIGQLGGVEDLTALVTSTMDGIPSAETMLDLGTMIAESFDPGEGGFRYEMVIPPTVGDLGDVTFDVVGLLDDAQLGWRLHIFAQPMDSGEGFSLMSVEATSICGRGVTAEGFCV